MTIYLSNLHPDKPDARDYIYAAPIPSGLPDKFDLLQFTNEIENQLRTNSCTANAGV